MSITKITVGNQRKQLWLIDTRELRERKHQLKMAIIPPIFRLCAEGFGIEEKDNDFASDVQRHVMGEEIVGVVMEKEARSLSPGIFKRKNNRPIAFISYRIIKIATDMDAQESDEIVYFSAVMVAKEYRGQGIAADIIRAVMRKHEIGWMALRTQNPVMRESVKGACQEVHPGLSGQQPPAEFMDRGQAIASLLGMEAYDDHLMIEKGTYGKMLYGEELPALRSELTTDALVINRAFWELLDVRNGGSMIIVGRDIKE